MWPRILPFVVVVVGAGFVLTRGPRMDWPVRNDRPGSGAMVAFGDSLTKGTGARRGESYPERIAARLGRPVINEGVNGDTAEEALGRIDRVLEHRPAVVLVTLGGNDLMHHVPRARTLASLGAIFDRLQAASAMVVYGAIDPPFTSDEWVESIRSLCEEKGVLYVPDVMEDVWLDGGLKHDQVHPNGEGYARVAERFLARLEDHL